MYSKSDINRVIFHHLRTGGAINAVCARTHERDRNAHKTRDDERVNMLTFSFATARSKSEVCACKAPLICGETGVCNMFE